MLNIKDLTVVFNEGTVNEKKAIDHLSLHLEPGDFVTIIGSNGAGKSTLLDPIDRKSTRLNSSHVKRTRMPSSA